MLTADDFRRIAVGMKDAHEGAHMGHPDFRASGKIFATLHPDHLYGMVKLTPDQQQEFVRTHPSAFAPESGAWGRAGTDAGDAEKGCGLSDLCARFVRDRNTGPYARVRHDLAQ
jgi:hypothetical protein